MWKTLIVDVTRVLNEDAFLNLVINSSIAKIKEQDKKLYTKIMYGVVDNKMLIDFLLKPYTSGKRFKPHLKNALRIGVYAISYLNLANFFIVTSLVEAVKKTDFKGSKAVNGILRRYISDNRFEKGLLELESLPKDKKEQIIYNLKEDVLKLIKSEFPLDYEEILSSVDESYNSYRINYLLTDGKEVINFLLENNIWYEEEEENIITKVSLIDTPLFKMKKIVPQDKSSIRVAKLLNPTPFSTVLDVCSAPGAKSFHMATIMENKGLIISCDIYEHKLRLIADEAKKLGINIIRTKLNDATSAVYDNQFDYILVDAPCSGLGTLKHKGDLRLRLSTERIEEIITLQKNILENVYKYLKKGGAMVYSTCTINSAENTLQIDAFLKKHTDLVKEAEYLYKPTSKQDGFYMCRIKKG